MEGPGKIYSSIAAVMSDVGHVAKDKINKQQGFKFRSVDDVYNALHPALAKNKVFIVPKILERTCEVVGKTKNGIDMVKVVCEIEFTFFAEDGSNVKAIITGEGLDTGDKGTNKAMAIAYKYACFQVFCIPTEEMTDPDEESIEVGASEQGSSNNKKSVGSKKKTTDKPAESSKKDENMTDEDSSRITEAMLKTIKAEQMRTGVKDEQILGMKVITAKTLSELTVREFKKVMDKFSVTPDLAGGARNE